MLKKTKFRPLLCRFHHHVAIVGSGPAGFYTAKYLLEQNKSLKIDIFEALPCPYGLVRYGVAPDHPEVKTVTNTFDEIAASPRVRYFGNVEIGDNNSAHHDNHLPLTSLIENYSKVVLSYGAHSDHNLNIPGESLKGVVSSRNFVNWYNGHPYFQTLHNENFSLSNCTNVIVIGQGNVALDCARVLAKSTDSLASTDISLIALSQLQQTQVKNIYILGRRGHVQSAFTIKELRELTKLSNVNVHIDPVDLQNGLTGSSQSELESSRPKKRIVELMQAIAEKSKEYTQEDISTRKNIYIKFLTSPVEVLPSLADTQFVGQLKLHKNKLTGEPFRQSPKSTGEEYLVPCDLLIKSIGYKCISISSLMPFDSKRNVVQNEEGRVVPGKVYVSGWLKRGASGIIGTNITDAKETVQHVLEDLEKEQIESDNDYDPIQTIRQHYPQVIGRSVSWNQVSKLLSHEKQLGETSQPQSIRKKVLSVDEMLRISNNK